MEFRTKYERKIVKTNPGDPIQIVKAGEYDKNHTIKVVPKGKKDLYAYINSFADSVNIHVLLARFKNGDTESLMQRAGAYIDISALPTNINEFIELSRNAETLFNSLPVEVKESFNNNVVEFISTIGDDSWKEKMAKSPALLKEEANENFKKAAEAHKKAIQGNTVYGDQVITEPVPDVSTQPVINPLTGNEVK